MLRRVVASLVAFAVAAGCSSFGSNAEPTPGADGGPSGDASEEAATGGDGSPVVPPDGSSATCENHIGDRFARNDVLGGPWQRLDAADPARVKNTDHRLDIETHSGVGPEKYMLTTGAFAAPRSLTCTFTFSPTTDFTTPNDRPIDLFVLVLTYRDGTSTQLHYGYHDAKLTVRDEHFDAEGKVCTACPAGEDTKSLVIPKIEITTLQIDVGGVGTQLTRNADSVTRPVSLTEWVSAEIQLGIWSFSSYGQQAYLDDLSCNLECP